MSTPTTTRRYIAVPPGPPALRVEHLSVWYGRHQAIRDISMVIPERSVTAIIGPSGCGKSTLLRALNRMHDTTPGARVEGAVWRNGIDLYGPQTDPVWVRRHIGMIFQRPNPFPKSIFDNVAFGLRVNGYQGDVAARVEQALRAAALWDEVKDKLRQNALTLSGGQQQRLCIARALAVGPEVLLMDEPTSALDPEATKGLERLACQLAGQGVRVVWVSHDPEQVDRIADARFVVEEGRVRRG